MPFILSLSITGAIFLFKPQINQWLDNPFHNLKVEGISADPQTQIEAAIKAIPGSSFSSYRLPEHQTQSTIITLTSKGERFWVYVNPYTLEVLKTRSVDQHIVQIVRELHGELKLGNGGSILIELVGCWAIVLILTGLYLWWPRNGNGLAGIIYPRLRTSKRLFWRDLHAVTGFWVAMFTLFLLISGLPWTLVWGSAFKEMRSIGKPAMRQDWSLSHHHSEGENHALTLTKELLLKAEALNFAHPVEITIDKRHSFHWKVESQHQNRPLRATAWFDSHSGEIVKIQRFADKKLLDQIIGIGIAAHEGHLFGWLNQLLGLLVTLGLCLVSISGFVMWRNRKPLSKLGAPPKVTGQKVEYWVVAITLALALVLPVLAGSLLLLFLTEKLILQHVPQTRAWLGL